VRRRPYSVILLDEVEKAHPEVFDVLLQVLDDGRLTDGQGRTVDFRNSIIILTSNMGSQFLIDTDVPFDERKDQVLAVVRQQFRPEFLNRLDAMVMFNPLDRQELMRIARIQIEQLQRRLDERRISIELTEDAQQWLVNTGFDPIYGARPLRRLVQTAVGDKLAVAILSGDIKDGDSVTVGADPDGSGLSNSGVRVDGAGLGVCADPQRAGLARSSESPPAALPPRWRNPSVRR
jgi:ATP-dependent Clp protease ATP-binding subunit ClpB